MSSKKSLPTPMTILMIVIVLAAISTWLLPAGQYNKLSAENNSVFVLKTPDASVNLPFTQRTLDSLSIKIPLEKFSNGDIRKAISVPNSYSVTERKGQGFFAILQAPIKGIMDSIDIVLFTLIIGGFMFVFNETGAIVKGVESLSFHMKDRMPVLISLLVFIFSFLGASYGMMEEALVFYPVLVPLFVAAGFDLLVPVAIIYGGTSVGWMSSFSNPFSTIIASNAAGINWMDGLYERILLFTIATSIMAWYIVRYAVKVHKSPQLSLVLQIDGEVHSPYDVVIDQINSAPKLERKTILLLLIYGLTFVSMIIGIVFYNWWTLEMSELFLGAAILVALVTGIKESVFVEEFIKGAASLLSVAFIIGVARGVTIVLNEGNVSDSILYYASQMVQHFPPAVFIVLILLFFIVFSLFISSSSGMAVLTMPIIGALAIIINIPGREIVNGYVFGMTIMSLLSPTGMLLPSLALVNVSLKAWMKFIMPMVLVLLVISIIFLIVGIYI
ncbi:MAG: YfcC family protein [Saprospiraceae bacterium]